MLKNGPNYDYLVFLILDSDFSVLISTRSPTLESRELGLHSPRPVSGLKGILWTPGSYNSQGSCIRFRARLGWGVGQLVVCNGTRSKGCLS